jgi:dTDP-4-amino-4,6-dideoxygalactose transaminase
VIHVRLNIPAWGGREIAAGAAALVRPGARRFSERLRDAIAESVPGWRPVLVASARAGLAMAVRMLALGGRRVAVPAYVCPAVVTGLRFAGADPVAVDCRPGSMRFDADALARLVSRSGVDAVVAPNTYGDDQDFETLAALGLPVIEDAAYQAGRTEPGGGRVCGTRGRLGVWSFSFKALTSVGGGVLLVPRDLGIEPPPIRPPGVAGAARFANLAGRALLGSRIPRWLPGAEAPGGERERTTPPTLLQVVDGGMSEVQAAVALAQWQARRELAARQRETAATIMAAVERCDPFAVLADQTPGATSHVLPLVVRGPGEDAPGVVDRVRRRLHEHGVQTERAYAVTLAARTEAPVAHDLAARLVVLPCSAALGRQEIGAIVRGLEHAARDVERMPGRGAVVGT